MFSDCTFNFHSDPFAWTYLYSILVFHVRRSRLNAGASWNTGANVEDAKLQFFGYCTLKCEESNHAWRELFFADCHESFCGFEDFFKLTLPHGYAHVSDFDVLGGYV